MGLFGKNIVLDEAAFKKAVEEFAALSLRLDGLRNEIDQMLIILKKGFDTPAGAKFISACEVNLFRPMDTQKIVLEHISKTLKDSLHSYESVFREYEALQAEINRSDSNK